MADEKQGSAPAEKPARKRATAAAPLSGLEQAKADIAARAEATPITPPAPDSDAAPPMKVGSGIHDEFGLELPTAEEFVRSGGKAEDYDSYVVARCSIKPESAVAPAPVAATAAVPGKVLAEQILADARRRRTGQSIEPPMRDDELVEDWKEAQTAKRDPAPKQLAGLYIVTHGTIWFHKDKVVPKGRKVMLSAEDAKAFLENETVRLLKEAS